MEKPKSLKVPVTEDELLALDEARAYIQRKADDGEAKPEPDEWPSSCDFWEEILKAAEAIPKDSTLELAEYVDRLFPPAEPEPNLEAIKEGIGAAFRKAWGISINP